MGQGQSRDEAHISTGWRVPGVKGNSGLHNLGMGEIISLITAFGIVSAVSRPYLQ